MTGIWFVFIHSLIFISAQFCLHVSLSDCQVADLTSFSDRHFAEHSLFANTLILVNSRTSLRKSFNQNRMSVVSTRYPISPNPSSSSDSSPIAAINVTIEEKVESELFEELDYEQYTKLSPRKKRISSIITISELPPTKPPGPFQLTIEELLESRKVWSTQYQLYLPNWNAKFEVFKF